MFLRVFLPFDGDLMNESLAVSSTVSSTWVIRDNIEDIITLAEKLDFLDIQILRKFYMSGKEYPFDCQPYCFPILYSEMKTTHKMKIGMEALRKRLGNLVRLDLLIKIRHSNPTSYEPIRDKTSFIKGVVARFFVINGLTKFL